MEIDLTPQLPKKIYGGDGGSYYSWSPKELPMLREGNIGASKLALEKNGFALPRYSDSAKVAYVLQGTFSIFLIVYQLLLLFKFLLILRCIFHLFGSIFLFFLLVKV